MRLAWPLTGRSEEMRLIEAALSTPDLSGIVICGAAGVGKSRVAREALAYAESHGCEIRWAIGTTSARGLPLGAFAQWAPSAETDVLQLVRGVIGSLTSTPQRTPVVVGVDDVHLLDDLSIFVLHQVVQRAAAKLILTVRSGEPVPAAIQEVWKGSQFERLDLQPLSQDETLLLVSATLGGSLNPDIAQRLWKLTRGNVLYLRNIVEQEVADGRLADKNGCWLWSGDPVVPASLVEMIESRIGTLPATVSNVIDALAVGEPIGLAALTRITDPAAVEEAEMLGLITLVPGETGVEARVAHPLYAEVRRMRAPSTRLRRLRGLVAAELAASDRGDDMRIVVRRASLSLDSDLSPDPELLVRAAQGAAWLADLTLADRLAAAAIRAGAGAEANFVRAHALSWHSRGPEADKILAETPTTDFTDADHARVAFLRAVNMIWTLADPEGAKRLIDAASRVASAEARSCVDAFLAVYWAAMGKPDTARQSSKGFALGELPHAVAAETAWGLVAAAGDAGRTAEAVSAAETGYAIAARGFDAAHMRFVIADRHIGALLLSGKISAAGNTAERMRQQAADLPGAAQLFSAALTGCAVLGAGKLDSACSLLGPVVEAFSAPGETIGFGYRYQLPHTIALAMRGSTTEAAAALVALEQMRHKSWRFLDYERELAHAWVAAAQGALTEAVAVALSAAETAGANGQFAAEVLCLQTAAQFGDGSGASRLRELEQIVEGPRAGLAARFAAALQDRDATELTTVSADFERIGDLVGAVDAAAHAAIAYRREALRGSALGCSAKAEALAERCGGAITPALRQATEQLPLSSREREIVMLIGEGLSNRAIAARLTLSVRTVEGHIYRAMTKTEVNSRDDLGALLPRRRS